MDSSANERCILMLADMARGQGALRERIADAWSLYMMPVEEAAFPEGLQSEYATLRRDLTNVGHECGSVPGAMASLTDQEVHEVTERIVRLLCTALGGYGWLR